MILLYCKSELLKKILADDFFKFRKNYVNEYLFQLIESYEIENRLDIDENIK